MEGITLEQLQAFLRVVEHGSFARAADGLGVQPSAVSRRVAALEELLGVPLLQRTTRRLSLTTAGQELAERAGPAVVALVEAADEVRRAETALAGPIRVSVPGALGRRRVAPLLFDFVRANPGVQLDLRVSDARLDLVAERIDLALRIGKPTDPAVVARLLARSPQRLVAPLALLGRLTGPLDPVAFGRLPRIVRREGGQIIDLPNPEAPPVLICDDVETVAAAVVAGLGFAVLPEWLARTLPEVRVLGLPLPIGDGLLFAVLPAGRRPPRRVRALLDFVAGALSLGGAASAAEAEGGAAGA
jgi:DNA-binding transcriptional LysR family regulator